MSDQATSIDRRWLAARLRRHTSELLRLAWPTILSRLGIIAMAIVDTVMVGRYATNHLAYLNLGNGTMIMVALVTALGMLMGTMVYTANAFGRGDLEGCGEVFKRSMPYALAVGAAGMLICLPGEAWLYVMGQEAELVSEGGRIMRILAFGLPGYMVYVGCLFFLEGVKRPAVGMAMMVVANLVNVVLNYALIFGKLGAPELGAAGSAWTTTVMRTGLGIGAFAYIWFNPSLRIYGVRGWARSRWSEWAGQRKLGYATGVALCAEVAAFAAMTICAGWLGTLAVAAYGLALSVISAIFMVAAGIGAATSVRVGIAHSRADRADTALAGWSGVGLVAIVIGIAAIGLNLVPRQVVLLYSDDIALIAVTVPLVAFAGVVLIFDGAQTALSNALRGLSETWAPTTIQVVSYMFVMIPVSYWLAIVLQEGVMGLLKGIVIGSLVSTVLQSWRFYWMTGGGWRAPAG